MCKCCVTYSLAYLLISRNSSKCAMILFDQTNLKFEARHSGSCSSGCFLITPLRFHFLGVLKTGVDDNQPWSQTTVVPNYHGPELPWSQTTVVPNYHGPELPWSQTTVVPNYRGPKLPWSQSTVIPYVAMQL